MSFDKHLCYINTSTVQPGDQWVVKIEESNIWSAKRNNLEWFHDEDFADDLALVLVSHANRDVQEKTNLTGTEAGSRSWEWM